MDPFWVVAAFVFGAASSRIGLPPLVGYLIAGFVLNSFGVEGSETLGKIADAAQKLNVITKEEQEKLGKNSEAGQSDNSPSDSVES